MERTYEDVLSNPPSIVEDLPEAHRDFLSLPRISEISLVAVSEDELLSPPLSWGACWECSSAESTSVYSGLAVLVIGYAAPQSQHVQYGCLLVHMRAGQSTKDVTGAIPEIREAIRRDHSSYAALTPCFVNRKYHPDVGPHPVAVRVMDPTSGYTDLKSTCPTSWVRASYLVATLSDTYVPLNMGSRSSHGWRPRVGSSSGLGPTMVVRIPLCTEPFSPPAEKVNPSLPSPERGCLSLPQAAFPSEMLLPCMEHHRVTLEGLRVQREHILARHALEVSRHDHSAADRLRILETRHDFERTSAHREIDAERSAIRGAHASELDSVNTAIRALGDSLDVLDSYSNSGKASVSATSHSSSSKPAPKSPSHVSASVAVATPSISGNLPGSPREMPVCTSSPAILLEVETTKTTDPDATEILESDDNVAVIEINQPHLIGASASSSLKKASCSDNGGRKRRGIKAVVYTEEGDVEDKPILRPAKSRRKDSKDLKVMAILPGDPADVIRRQCYGNDTPHVIQAREGYMQDYPDRFYTGFGATAELRDANEGGVEDVSEFLKDFIRKQDIEGLHLLQTDSSDMGTQQLIAMARAEFPHARFLRVITDASEGVDGRKDYTGLLGNLHTKKALTRKVIPLVSKEKVERTFCPWCVKASGTAGPLLTHIMEHYRLVLGCGRCHRECFESSLTFRSHYWNCQGATSSQ